MSLGKPVVVFQNMDEDMQKFAVESAQDSLATMFHEQVSNRWKTDPIRAGDRHLLKEVIRNQVQI